MERFFDNQSIAISAPSHVEESNISIKFSSFESETSTINYATGTPLPKVVEDFVLCRLNICLLPMKS